MIANTDSEPKQVVVKTSQGYEPVTLAAGGIWREPGKVWVRYEGREILINENEEYAFWAHEGLSPQRHMKSSSVISLNP